MVPVEDSFCVISSMVAVPVVTAVLAMAARRLASMRWCTTAPPMPMTASAMTARRMFLFAFFPSPFFGFTSSATVCPLLAYGST